MDEDVVCHSSVWCHKAASASSSSANSYCAEKSFKNEKGSVKKGVVLKDVQVARPVLDAEHHELTSLSISETESFFHSKQERKEKNRMCTRECRS